VGRKNERREAGVRNLYAKFLAQLADKTSFRRLARLDLSARKFPQTGQLLALRALADQHPAVGIDESRGCDEYDRLGEALRHTTVSAIHAA